MKLNLRLVTAPCLLAIPLCLAGCQDKNASPTDSTSAAYQTNATRVEADNSGKNVRDRDDAALTPGDQGNSTADREITRNVRRAIVSSTNDYSVSARNIKIITADGKVALRGPVKTEAEKTGIVAIAKNTGGVASVDDELEVKASR